MTPIALSPSTKSEFTLADARLLAIAWENEGKDLRLDLLTADGRIAKLHCTWICAPNLLT